MYIYICIYIYIYDISSLRVKLLLGVWPEEIGENPLKPE